jgi:hypothetical protein
MTVDNKENVLQQLFVKTVKQGLDLGHLDYR